MEIKVHNQIRQKPVILGLRLKSFFILLFGFVMLALWMLGSFSITGLILVAVLTVLLYGILYSNDRYESETRDDFPDCIENI